MGALATKKRNRTAVEEAEELTAQEAEAIIVQYELDEQFARDAEETIRRRGEAPLMSSPTPAPRPKRATRAPVRFDRTVGKANGKKDKGKGRQM